MARTQFSRQQLYDAIWSKSAVKLAKEIGVSDVAISKACKRYEIPKPPLGYWAKVAHGKKVTKPPLPKLDNPHLQTILFDPSSYSHTRSINSSGTIEKVIAENLDETPIVVADTLTSPHPLVERTEKSLRSAVTKDGLVQPKTKGCLDVIVGPDSIDRAMRIMDALIKALVAKGLKVSTNDTEPGERRTNFGRHYNSDRVTLVQVDGEMLSFRMTESVADRPAELTPAQQKDNEKYRFLKPHPTTEKYARGPLALNIRAEGDTNISNRWTELNNKKSLDIRLNEIVAWFLIAAKSIKDRRRQFAERERQWAEAEKRRGEAAELKRIEDAKIVALEKEVASWHQAKDIREYIDAAERHAIEKHGAITPGGDFEKRLQWARNHADSIDPLRRSRNV